MNMPQRKSLKPTSHFLSQSLERTQRLLDHQLQRLIQRGEQSSLKLRHHFNETFFRVSRNSLYRKTGTKIRHLEKEMAYALKGFSHRFQANAVSLYGEIVHFWNQISQQVQENRLMIQARKRASRTQEDVLSVLDIPSPSKVASLQKKISHLQQKIQQLNQKAA